MNGFPKDVWRRSREHVRVPSTQPESPNLHLSYIPGVTFLPKGHGIPSKKREPKTHSLASSTLILSLQIAVSCKLRCLQSPTPKIQKPWLPIPPQHLSTHRNPHTTLQPSDTPPELVNTLNPISTSQKPFVFAPTNTIRWTSHGAQALILSDLE